MMMLLKMDFSHFFDIFAIPFGYVMQGFNWLCQGHYALSLLLFALVVKLLTLPLAIKQQKTQIKGAKLRPKMMLIEKKYAGRTDRATLQKKQQEIMEMQRKEGYSPLSGCLPLLIQLPVLFGLYRVIRMPLKYVCNLTDELVVKLCNGVELLDKNGAVTVFEKLGKTESSQIKVIDALRAGGDKFKELLTSVGLTLEQLPEFDLFGKINLAYNPGFKLEDLGGDKINYWLLAIPVLCAGFAYLSAWLTRKLNDNGMNAAASGDQKISMMIMNLTMPLMSGWIAFITPGAIGLYWVYTSILGIIQTLLLAKFMPMPKYTEEEIKEMQKAMKDRRAARSIVGTSVDENGKPKSLHYSDDDDQY